MDFAGTLAEELGYSLSIEQIKSVFQILQLPLDKVLSEGEFSDFNSRKCSKNEYVSRINNNGVPLQIVVSNSQGRNGLGFLSETGDMNYPHSARVAAAEIRLVKLFESSCAQVDNVSNRFKRISSVLLPGTPDGIDNLKRGSFWFSLRFLHSGKFYCSVYFNGKWGNASQRNSRPVKLLAEYSCFESILRLKSIQSFLEGFSRPIGQAVSIGTTRNGVCKFYYRASEPSTENIEELYSRLGMKNCYKDFITFSRAVLPPFPVFPEQSIVFSIEFNLDEDKFTGIKIDACSHCLPHGDRAYAERWSELLNCYNMSPSDYIRALEVLSGSELNTDTVNHAFLGVGHEVNGSLRFNAYLRPGEVIL